MENINLKRDLQEAQKIIDDPNCCDDSYYGSYSKIFNAPTVNHKDLFTKMNAKWQKYLGVMASTNPMLDAVSFGAKKITLFDVNHLNVHFMYLQIAAVLSLEYEEYLDYFYSKDLNKYFNISYFNKLKSELPSAVANFWHNLYETYKDVKKISNLFCGKIENIDDKFINLVLISSHNFLEREAFYRLKFQLKQIELIYFIEDFGNIPSLLKREKFDVIYLSVMQNCIWDNVHGYNYFEKLKEYENLLSENGVIQGGYIYWQHYKKDRNYCNWFIELFEKNNYEKQKINIITGEEKEDYYNIAMLKRNKTR